MHDATLSGSAGSQTPRHTVLAAAPPPQPTAEPPLHAQQLRRLLDARGAAALWGIGSRKFAAMLAEYAWLAELAIQFGPRQRRWDPDELMSALRQHMPRGQHLAEPEQLRRARVDRRRGGAA